MALIIVALTRGSQLLQSSVVVRRALKVQRVESPLAKFVRRVQIILDRARVPVQQFRTAPFRR